MRHEDWALDWDRERNGDSTVFRLGDLQNVHKHDVMI